MILATGRDRLELQCSSIDELNISVDYNDFTGPNNSRNTKIVTIGIHVILSPKEHGSTITYVSIVNSGAGTNNIQLFKNDGYVRTPQSVEVPLDPGESFTYTVETGWNRYNTDGELMTHDSGGGGGGGGGAMSFSALGHSATLDKLVFSNNNGVSFGLVGSILTASHDGLTTQLNQAFSAQGGSSAFQTLIFTNSNGMSFSNTGGSIWGSYTVPSVTGLLSAVKISAGTLSHNLSAVTFADGSGVSFGLNGSVLTASVKTDYQTSGAYLTTAMHSNAVTLSNIKISAGADSVLLSSLVFSNENNISFGLAGSSITASASFLQSVQPAMTIEAGTETISSGSVVFSNANGLAFGMDAGTITGSYTVPSVTEYQFISNSSLSLGTGATASFRFTSANFQLQFTSANTNFRANTDAIGLNSAITQNGVSMTANSSGLSLNFPAFLTTAQPVGAYLTTARASTDAIGLNSAITQNGVSMTANSSGLSLNFPAFLTTAMQSASSSNFAGLGFTSTSTNGTDIKATHNTAGLSVAIPAYLTTAQPVGAYLTTARASNDAVGLNTALTANGVAWTVNSSGISLNVPAFLTTADLSANSSKYVQNWKLTGNTAGTTSSAQGIDLWLAGGNGLTISGSGNTLSFSVATNYQSQGAYLTTARASTDAIGLNTAKTNVTWTVNSSGISLDAGAYLTTAMASNANTSFVGLNSALTANGVAWTVNSSGISLNVPAFLTTAMQSASSSNFAGLGFTSTSTNGTDIKATHNTAGLSMAIPAYLTAAGGVQTGISSVALSNVTYTSGQISFKDGNGISFGSETGQGISLTHGLQYTSATSAITANALNTSAARIQGVIGSNTTYTSGSIGFRDLNGISWQSTTGQSFQFTHDLQYTSLTSAITSKAAGTGTSATNASITLNSNGLQLSVATPPVFNTYSSSVIGNDYPSAQASISLGQNSLYFFPQIIGGNISLSVIKFPVMVTLSSSAAGAFTRGHTASFAVYTRQVGANSSAISRLYSSSYTIAAVMSSNANMSISVITAVQNSTSYNSVAANSAGLNLSLSVHGGREFIMPWNTLLSSGEYWFAFAQSSSSAGGVGNVLNVSNVIGTYQSVNRMGISTAASDNGIMKNMALGTYSATSGGWPNAVTFTEIRGGASWPIGYLFLDTV